MIKFYYLHTLARDLAYLSRKKAFLPKLDYQNLGIDLGFLKKKGAPQGTPHHLHNL